MRAFLIDDSLQRLAFELFGPRIPGSPAESKKTPVFLETSPGELRMNPLRGRRSSALLSQCLSQRACNLLPTMNLPDIDLESDGRRRPDQRDFPDRSAARAACRGLRAMPKNYISFQGGNRWRRRIAALYDAWFIRIHSARGDRVDCRGARRNRVARIERQYIATDNGRSARRRGAPFGSDQHDRPSSGRWQETMKWI
jgi:hypothetical protein